MLIPAKVTTLQEELALLAAEYEKAIAKTKAKYEVSSMLPDGLDKLSIEPIRIYDSGYKATKMFGLIVDKLADVQAIFDKLPGVTLVDVKDGARSVYPEDSVTEGVWKRRNEGFASVKTGIAPFRLSVDGGRGWGDITKVDWWTDLGSIRVYVVVEVKHSGLLLSRQAHYAAPNGDLFAGYYGETKLIGATKAFAVKHWYEIKYSPGSDQAKHNIVCCWDIGQAPTPGAAFA